MSATVDFQTPKRSSYDVIIVGGAMYGSSVAWWLSDNSDFDGTVLVVERNPTYENTSTTCTNSCIRQQFSNEINVQVSQRKSSRRLSGKRKPSNNRSGRPPNT